jgi:hypothetical protein
MSNNKPRRLSTREKQALEPVVKAAQHHDEQARVKWLEVGQLLDKFESRGHSQCCQIGGMCTGARNSCSGETPCPCGWDSPESPEDVLRRMVKFIGDRTGPTPDQDALDLVGDALAALNRARNA